MTPARTAAQNTEKAYLPVSLMPMPTPTATATATRIPIPTGSIIPNDEYYGDLWGMTRMRAPEAWTISTGQEVVIAILDTGIDYTHPEFTGRLVSPSLWYDFSNNDTDPMDGEGHGTHVSGSAAAAANNGVGVAGVAWNARIMPLKVLNDEGSGYLSWSTAAIEHATNNGAKIINMSLGSESYSGPLQSAIDYAVSRGVVVIAASGNCHQVGNGCDAADPVTYPAAMSGVIGVGATTREDAHASYSTMGYYVDVSAPGGDYIGDHDLGSLILSTIPTHVFQEGYAWGAGTSMAAPHVTGVAALLLKERPSLTPGDIAFILGATAADLGAAGRDDAFGHGRVDARAALESVWYMNNPRIAPEPIVQAAPATNCSVAHASDRLMLRQSAAATRARQSVLDNVPTEILHDLSEWQVLKVPTGQACSLMKALNASGGQVVAELDPLVSLSPHEMFSTQK
ncbi:MAG: S8 family serine peptidase [Ardenticatenales bacterium]|nr:S8 family serine peptidase [Ardenticatenales bacterium]